MQLCARCSRPAVGASAHLHRLSGAGSSKRLPLPLEDNVAAWRCARFASTPCPKRGTAQCTDAYCSAECRDAAAPWHSLLCTHGAEEGDSILAFASATKGAGHSEGLAPAARILASLFAEALAGDPAPGQAAEDCDRLAAALAAQLEPAAPPPTALQAQEPVGAAVGGSSNPNSKKRQASSSLAAPARRQRAELETERRELEDEALAMLRVGLVERAPAALHAALSSSALLDASLWARLVGVLRERWLPVQVPSPLVAYCTALAAEDDPRRQAAALRALLPVAAARTKARAVLAGGGGPPEEVALHALLRAEAEDEAREAAAALADGESEAGAEVERGTAAAVKVRRRACLMAQCAARLFPPANVAVFAPGCGRLPHSCIPCVQLQALPPDAEDAKAAPACHGCAPPLRAALVRVRPAASATEALSVAWVDVAAHDVTGRELRLRARFGDDSLVCSCERCAYERGTELPAAWLVALARDAMEDGRLGEAIDVLGRALADDGASAEVLGDAWHLLGMARLNNGQWKEAHRVWHEGMRAFPTHRFLQLQHAKDEQYADADADAGGASGCSAACTPRDWACEVHDLPEGAGRAVCSIEPILAPDECAAVVRAAEEHAAGYGGWTTTRHHAVPTTDIPVHAMPGVLRWFKGLMEVRISPLIAQNFGVPAAAVRVHDAFVVKYSAGRQAHLPFHSDESQLSITIPLNAKSEFVGGGTYFAALRRALSPEAGHAVVFDGRILHGGEPIVAGTRYIIAAFLHVERDDEAELAPPRSRPRCAGCAPIFVKEKAAEPGEEAAGFSFGFDSD